MNKDQVEGEGRQVKGKSNETGKAFGNKSLEERGKIVNTTDNVQKNHGNGKGKVKK